MTNPLHNHPLNGTDLKTLLGELVREYGWEILAEQININAFKNYPTFESSVTFLKKSQWAREKLEAFYLYKFKQFPRPVAPQHEIPPRQRLIDLNPLAQSPATIVLGDPEFFDDPISGRVPSGKKSKKPSRSNAKFERNAPEESVYGKRTSEARSDVSDSSSHDEQQEAPSGDPWGNWKNKNGADADS